MCGNGVYWCDHVYDPAYPWKWVDFIFLSQKYPKHHYYAVALTTLEYHEHWLDDETAWNWAEQQVGPDPADEVEDPQEWFNNAPSPIFEQKLKLARAEHERLVQLPRMSRPHIKLAMADYRPGCIGVHAAINTTSLNDNVIRQFITDFYSLGEPIHEGIIWSGEEVLVIPANINTPDVER